jgi:hypothetical protein
MLRHVDHDQVTVFLALRDKRTITLRVHAGINGTGQPLLSGQREAVRVGTNLSLVAVTATPVGSTVLQPETTYCYDLDLGDGLTLTSDGALAPHASDAHLGYGAATLPTFALPPLKLDQVRLVHGSCRKPHGESFDALPSVDEMLRIVAKNTDIGGADAARGRPHQLFLTGDQIYADDVADCLLFMLTDAASALLTWNEPVPGATAATLRPGARADLTLAAGLTTAVSGRKLAKSHLMTFGEFASMYLFTWSPTLWPANPETDLPLFLDVLPPDIEAEAFLQERDQVVAFARTIGQVRKALANVPTYMILDDHEVTDDWLMNRRWTGPPDPKSKRQGGALATPLGRRIQQNALYSYALFQAWGNTPEQFADFGAQGEPGRALLVAASAWRGSEDVAYQAIGERVGIPKPLGVSPDGKAETSLTRPAGALRWHYLVAPQGAAYEVLMLDCRTAREYPPPSEASAVAPAGLLTAVAIQDQVSDPRPPGPVRPDPVVTLVVAQTPVLGIPKIEEKQKSARGDDIWNKDVEAWSLNEAAYQRLLGALAHRRQRVVVLSGDVHYSFAARMSYRAGQPFGFPALPTPRVVTVVQLNSSALRNETSDKTEFLFNTLRLHVGGYHQFYVYPIANDINRVGWAQPQTTSITLRGAVLSALSRPPGWDRSPAVIDQGELPTGTVFANPPEWTYQVKYLPGRRPTPSATVLPRIDGRPADTKQQLKDLHALQRQYLAKLDNDAGLDIVGRNNIGELHFATDPTGTPTSVEQTTWWRFEDTATLVPTTVYTLALTLDPP